MLVSLDRNLPPPLSVGATASEEVGELLADRLHPLFKWYRSKSRSKSARKRLRKLFTTIRFVHKLRFSENYLAVKGAALILPQSECARRAIPRSTGGDIQRHLQLMIYLLRPQDTIKVAVKLESASDSRDRYLALVASTGRQDTEESIILGIDLEDDKASIGLMLPIWGDTDIRLDGDGGFVVRSDPKEHIFKPVSVQAMWSALQTLMKMSAIAQKHNYHPKGLTHTWATYYGVRIHSSQDCLNEWNAMDDLFSKRNDRERITGELGGAALEEVIRTKLRGIMMTVDLEEVTCKYLRSRLEEEMHMTLSEYKAFIDEEMITIMGQMDSPSRIFDFLYLGSEWNASNLDELQSNGVGYILNVTREIDNFFPGHFEYFNVRLWDRESSELMKHWDKTYKFIKRAKHSHSKVLVHCKMGVSRSAATVIAFAMKEYGWGLDEALKYVRNKRAVIMPNQGFMNQLVTYQGILDASKQRHNMLWRSPSASNLSKKMTQMSIDEDPDPLDPLDLDMSLHNIGQCRPRSWSPTDGASELLYKTQHLAFDVDSSEEEESSATYVTSHSASLPPREAESHSSLPQPVPTEDAHIPLPFRLEDFDEYDVSSRSADSLDIDEAFLDTFTPDERLAALLEDSPVILLQHRMLDFETESHAQEETGLLDQVSDESDFEDFDPETDRKPARGFYDVSMLSGYQDPAVAQRDIVTDKENGNVCADDDSVFTSQTLHPDMKLELALSEYRKNCRIAKFIRLQQLSREEMKLNGAQLIQAESEASRSRGHGDGEVQTHAAQRVRKDDFWIRAKSIVQETNSVEVQDEKTQAEQSVLDLEGVCVTESSPDVDVSERGQASDAQDAVQDQFKPIEHEMRAESVETVRPVSTVAKAATTEKSVLEATACAQPPRLIRDERSTNESTCTAQHPQTGQDGVKSAGSTPTTETGVWQHYQKEAIPWSPGTVRRKRQEMEERYSTSDASETAVARKTPASVSEMAPPNREVMTLNLTKSADVGSAESKSDVQSVESAQCFATPDSVFGSPAQEVVDRSKPSDMIIESKDAKIVGANHTQIPPATPEAANQSGPFAEGEGEKVTQKAKTVDGQSVWSVYAQEDIPHVPDRVRRIKQLLEERERSCSDGDVHKSVQRSSSWKQTRRASERFDRKSERRKTVLPVIRPVSTVGKAPNMSKDDSTVEQTDVYFVAEKLQRETEVIPTSDDLGGEGQQEDVKVIKIGSDTVEMIQGKVKKRQKEYEEISCSSSLPTPQHEGRSVSPFVEELTHPVSVRKQTQDIEKKYSSSPTHGSRSPVNQPVSRERAKTVSENKPSVVRPKTRTHSESSPVRDSPVSHASPSELVPAFERILSKSPSLQRKLGRSEVIACHSPDSDNTFHSISSIASSCDNSVSDSVSRSGSDVAKERIDTATQSDSEMSPKRGHKLLKAASVPLFLSVVSCQGSEDVTTSTASECLREQATQTGVPMYVEEGIEWSVGTVKQQLQAKFESMGVKSEVSSPVSSSSVLGLDSKQTDQSKEVVIEGSNQKEPEGTEQAKFLNSPDSQAQCTEPESSVVKKITGKIEGKHKKRKTHRMVIIEKTKGKPVSRAHSLGSRKDVQSKQSPPTSPNQVGRASSFKEDSCPQSRSRVFEWKLQERKPETFEVVQSEIATHRPVIPKVPKKQVVIIPKVDSNIERPKSSSLSSSTGAKNQSKGSTVSVSGDQSNSAIRKPLDTAPEKPSCDIDEDAMKTVTKDSGTSPVAHHGSDSNEDISVKELCDIFEPKEKKDTESSGGLNQCDVDDSKSNVLSRSDGTDTQASSASVTKKRGDTTESGGVPQVKSAFSSQRRREFDNIVVPRKTRKLHGKTHPLAKLACTEQGMTRGKLYSTM